VGRNINIDLNITLAKSLKKIKKYEEINENLISYKLKENLTKKIKFFPHTKQQYNSKHCFKNDKRNY